MKQTAIRLVTETRQHQIYQHWQGADSQLRQVFYEQTENSAQPPILGFQRAKLFLSMRVPLLNADYNHQLILLKGVTRIPCLL
jgi:hypothetical protein